MRRYPFVIGGTVAGLAGLLSFHSRSTTTPLSHVLPVRASAPTRQGQSPSVSSTSTTASQPAPSTTTTQGAPVTSSATGAGENYGYGIVSVSVSVNGSRITDVKVASIQTDTRYSQQIATQVIPYLRNQVLSAQSANINGISGATYTSEGYALSVQSALDQLHFK